MASFATEADVREKLQLTDTTAVPSTLVVRSIDDAHAAVMRVLDPQFDVPTPESQLVLGETLLAGAMLVQSLAASAAFDRTRLSIGGNRIEPSDREKALGSLSESLSGEAWEFLGPYLLPRAGRRVAEVTDSQPVLGES